VRDVAMSYFYGVEAFRLVQLVGYLDDLRDALIPGASDVKTSSYL
jgi:hypothetical protein